MKSHRYVKVLVFHLSFLLCGLLRGQDEPSLFWYYYVVDKNDVSPTNTSLAYDSKGLPSIAYRGAGNYYLKYAKFDGIKWTTETIYSDWLFGRIQMAIGPDDRPYILFHSNYNGTSCALAYKEGESWVTRTISDSLRPSDGYTLSMKVDSQNRLHIIYPKHILDQAGNQILPSSLKYLRYDRHTDAKPAVSNYVEFQYNGKWNSLTFNENEQPVVAYWNNGEYVKVAFWENNKWLIEDVTPGPFLDLQGWYTSIARGGNNYFISFYHTGRDVMRLATGRRGSWDVEDVVNLGSLNFFESPMPIAVDNNSNPYIAYHDVDNGDLKIAYKYNGAWRSDIVDSAGYVGGWASLALTAAGSPAISYWDATNRFLKIAISSPTPPEDTDTDLIPDYLEVLNGTNPLDTDTDDDGLSDGEEDKNQNGIVDADETAPLKFDTDGDGLSDGLEVGRTRGISASGDILGTDMTKFSPDLDPGTVTNNLVADSDADGLSDGEEDLNKNGRSDADETDPLNPDTDSDGLLDGVEGTLGTKPLDVDTDDDGLADGAEDKNRNGIVDSGETDPLSLDSDDDGVSDGVELGVTAPINDPDGAGKLLGTDLALFVADLDPATVTLPTVADTDQDGALDGQEDVNGNGRFDDNESDPLNPDTDSDGLLDGIELRGNTGPLDLDSDDDGLADGEEDRNRNGVLDPGETSPSLFDTDGDKLSDGLELGRTQGVADSDGAGILRGTDSTVFMADSEHESQTDPRREDTDEDGRIDGDEDINANGKQDEGETDPLNWDSDGDSVSDGDEVNLGTDPLDRDSVSLLLLMYETAFSDASLPGWTVVDDGTIEGPSDWLVVDNVLVQLSNIFGSLAPEDPADLSMLGTFIWSGEKTWQHYIIEFEMLSDDDDALGIMFRYVDERNYYRFSLSKELKKVWCIRFADGGYDVLIEKDFDYELGHWHKVRVSAIDSHFELVIDGERILSITDTVIPKGAFAFYTWKNSAAGFRNLKVKGPQMTAVGRTPDYIRDTQFSLSNNRRIISVELHAGVDVRSIQLAGITVDDQVEKVGEQISQHSRVDNPVYIFSDPRPWQHERYRLSLYDAAGHVVQENELTADETIVNDFTLYPAYPNPFHDDLQLVLRARQNALVRYYIYNLLGQIIYSGPDESVTNGWKIFHWNGMDMQNVAAPNGTYIIRLEIFDPDSKLTPIKTHQQKVLLLRR
ncbi:T9SS type A sorting domain-containing protein [candidate division KSB1 bacterium]|nr:T9SS type A sorting domain-containing protein [candidate division KSB1 bacterium]